MKTIVFISTQKSGSSREAIKAARQLGYETVLLTNRISQMNYQEDFPDVSQMVFCDVNDYRDLKENIRKLQEDGLEIETIISFIDCAGYVASVLAQELGIGCFTTDAIFKMQDKILSRECLKNTKYAPWFQILKRGYPYSKDEIKRRLPLILKDPNSTGSKDVYLVNSLEEFSEKLDRLMSYQDAVIVEQYLEGPQYLVETLVENKEVKIIAIIEQEIYLYQGHSIITGYALQHHLPKDIEISIKKAVIEIIAFHGMENGSCHLELRYVKNEWKLIEINPRISGGAMNELILYGTGINLVKETLHLALKEPLQLKPIYEMDMNVQHLISLVSGKLIKVTGMKEALNSDGVVKIFVKPRRGNMIYPPISMGNRYAYVIAYGESEHIAKVNAKVAANKIKFHILKE